MEATVALVRTRPETVLQDYARLLDLAGLTAPEEAREPLAVLLDLDPQMRTAMPAAASPPWQVEGVVRGLLAKGRPAEHLRVAAPPAARGGSEQESLWQSALSRCGPVVSGPASAAFDTAVQVLSLAALRTDRRLGLPGCLATLAAFLAPSTRPIPPYDRLIANLSSALRRRSGATVLGGVVDAAICGAGPDASSLRPVALHLLLAGRDPLAVDAVAAWLVGLDTTRLPLLQAAVAAGLGCGDPARIGLVGDTGEDLPRLDLMQAARFSCSRVVGRAGGRFAFFGLTLRPPWAVFQARRVRQRHAETAWGRLQHHYARGDSLASRGAS